MSLSSNNFMGFQTMDEMVNWTYDRTPEEIRKAGYSTSSPGIYNPLYGAMVWANFNLEANIFSALPKFIWDFSGWRIYSTKAPKFGDEGNSSYALANINNSPLGGTKEGGLIAEAVVPTVKEISVKPKTLQYDLEASEVLEQLVDHSRDDNFGSLAQQRVYGSEQFKENVNLMLGTRVDSLDVVSASDGAYEYSLLNIETLDRIVSSNAEFTANTPTNQTNNYNPWDYVADNQIDRNVDTTYDSVVVAPGGNLTYGQTDVLTDAVLRSTMADVRISGGKEGSLFLGGQDTYNEIQSIYMAAYRIQNTADLRTEFSVGVNGVDTFTGTGAGLHISTVYGVPFIPSKDSPANSGDVGDLFLLNTASDKMAPGKPQLGIQTLKPFVYYEASKRQQAWPYTTGGFNDKAMYQGLMETTCRNFKVQGKIINIASGI